MTAPITPDERAEWRALADAATEGPWEVDGSEVSQHWSRPEPWLTVASNEVACMSYCYGGSARGIERDEDAAFIAAARTAVPRLLDALDTAEAEVLRIEDLESEVGRTETYLRLEREAARRNLERAERAEAEVARLRATVSPAWDEDTVTEDVARALRALLPLTPEPALDATATAQADAALAVFRRHLPVRPDRETIARALRDAGLVEVEAVHEGHGAEEAVHAHLRPVVTAVLTACPGESRATVQAGALHDAADAVVAQDNNQGDWWDDDRQTYCTPAEWLRARADRSKKGDPT